MSFDIEKCIELGKTFGLEGAELLTFVKEQHELGMKQLELEREEKRRKEEEEKEEKLRRDKEESEERLRRED